MFITAGAFIRVNMSALRGVLCLNPVEQTLEEGRKIMPGQSDLPWKCPQDLSSYYHFFSN